MAVTYYKCYKCSRITNGYPIGCHRLDCPVKGDVISDFISGLIVVVVIVGGYLYALTNIGK